MTDEPKGAVGYGRPPVATQFKQGRSGNPNGRPKKSRSLQNELLEELGELMRIRDGSNEHEISKARAIVKALVRAAVGGNMRAMAIVLSSCARQGRDADVPQDELGDSHDSEILNDFVGRELRRRARQCDETADSKPQPPAERTDENEK